ncbi:MAG: LytTR family DNA-binding domain-containing protein [Bacteroidales bacterium]|nr:LytTR family DNA-binding domain-containing protein [Bacteroidales bacterium]
MMEITKNKISCLIIEDEKPARDLIKSYLSNYKNIELLAECKNGFEGIKAINEYKPDIIFLDIQMPKLSGFEMLELLDEVPEVIFTTAYDQFAIKAFEMNAVDYLMKPFSRERFSQSLEKAITRIKNETNNQVKPLIDHINKNKEILDKIVVKSGSKVDVISLNEIINIEAEDDYVMIYTKNKRYLKKETMNYYEKHLPPSDFIRIHRSNIVKINQIKQIEHYAKENYLVILTNGSKLKVSKSRLKELKAELDF